jgi:Heterokaryon incompatibility protein (HET)
MMRDIYQNAQSVTIWLGPAHDADQKGFDLLQRLDGLVEDTDNSKLFTQQFFAAEVFGQSPSWASLFRLFQRPWFSRMWVVQELLYARQYSMLCGDYSIDPRVLFRVVRKFVEMHDLRSIGTIAAASQGEQVFKLLEIYTLGGLKEDFDDGRLYDLIELCAMTKDFQTTDPRDKVFALMGLASDVGPDFIDYRLEIDDIRIRVAKARLMPIAETKKAPLDLLSSAAASRDDSHGSKVPSWVPTFQHNYSAPLAISYRLRHHRSTFDQR